MFNKQFAHFLSYGATDQTTARELGGYYDGLLVPGTVAAFQRQGTGGFVLTLSATAASPDYVIDPRFPLFLQALPRPKKSHEELAGVLGSPGLIRGAAPKPSSFTPDLIAQVAHSWVAFNQGYLGTEDSKFAKYAKRLGEQVDPSGAKHPLLVLAPYACVIDSHDPWWQVSKDLFEATKAAADQLTCVRVVSTQTVGGLPSVLHDVPETDVAIWVSRFNELERNANDLASYLAAIQKATAAGKRLFSLYGGFFAVLASGAGLVGSSHGIGYGESRDWLELPNSGPPPARYYLPKLHRYVSQELAYQLWLEDRELAECDCNECAGQPPIALEYHSLMKHSVLSRAREIEEWVGMSLASMGDRLEQELSDFELRVARAAMPDHTARSARQHARHLPVWIEALRQVA